jgi:hypothetical protein
MTVSSVLSHLLIIMEDIVCLLTDASGCAEDRRGSATARLLGLRFRISRWAYMSVPFECYMLSDVSASG